MTTTATFGDFLRQAGQHLDAAAPGSQDELADPAVRELRRMVTGMTRFLDDRTPVDVIEAFSWTGLSVWERAVIDTRAALHQAASCLTEGIGVAGGAEGAPENQARSLAATAASLAAGRDLLHTHLTVTVQEMWQHRSDWAPVLASPPVTRALTDQVARWSRQLAPIAAGLASAGMTGTPDLAARREALQVASQWLRTAGAAVRPAQAAEPVIADDIRLLHAVPAAQPPGRLPPGGAESVTELCAGITVSAQRLRAAVSATARQPPQAPGRTAATWRWTARAIAVTGHASELALRSLAGHRDQPGNLPGGEMLFQAAAEAIAQSWVAWRQVGVAWNGLTTETRGHVSPAVPEISDLVLRTGRLTWDDPQWTPARTSGAAPRDLTNQAPSDASIAAVIGALHEAADAFAQVAAADLKAATTADRAGRLYVTTRSLPGAYDIPRPYATAPADRTEPLLHAYQAAVQASTHAADTLADLALASNAPSSTLALARAAARPRHVSGLEESVHPGRAAPGDRREARPAERGPVERAVRSLQVADPILLLRAAAIDNAARQLIAQAEQAARPSGQQANDAPAVRRSAAGSAARLAAKDTPSAYPAVSAEGDHAQAATRRPGVGRAPRSPRAPQT
jgi:hypothetical protein